MDWLFDGLGTMVLGLFLGGATGGAIGHRVGVRSLRQKQQAGKNSQQTQVGNDWHGDKAP